MSDIKWDIVCGEDHGVHFRNTWLIWIKYLYSCIDIEKIEKIMVFFPVSTWTHLAFLKPQHSPEMCSTNFLPAAWRTTRTTFFFSLCTWPLTSHIWSLSNLILPKKGKSQPCQLNSVPLTEGVKKITIKMMQAELASYVVVELGGSKREMNTVLSKAEPLRSNLPY